MMMWLTHRWVRIELCSKAAGSDAFIRRRPPASAPSVCCRPTTHHTIPPRPYHPHHTMPYHTMSYLAKPSPPYQTITYHSIWTTNHHTICLPYHPPPVAIPHWRKEERPAVFSRSPSLLFQIAEKILTPRILIPPVTARNKKDTC